MLYDNVKMDLFEQAVSEWILSKEGRRKFHDGELTIETSRLILDEIVFNVIDEYRRLIRFPERCPDCTRNGLDHDGECTCPEWQGKDYGIFKEN